MEKPKPTKKTITELMNKLLVDKEKSKESFFRQEGALGLCNYILEKFDFGEEAEEKEKEVVGTNHI